MGVASCQSAPNNKTNFLLEVKHCSNAAPELMSFNVPLIIL
jgi:hypothetical protein